MVQASLELGVYFCVNLGPLARMVESFVDKSEKLLGVMLNIYNPITWEAKAEGW